MKKVLKVLLGIIIGIVVIGAILLGVAFFAVNGQTTKKEITFGDEDIPTIYAVVGERKVISVGSGITDKFSYTKVTYDEDVISNDDVAEYVSHLKDEEDFVVTENESNLLQLAKESEEEGELLLVNIMKENDSTVIEYRKGEGTLTIY